MQDTLFLGWDANIVKYESEIKQREKNGKPIQTSTLVILKCDMNTDIHVHVLVDTNIK